MPNLDNLAESMISIDFFGSYSTYLYQQNLAAGTAVQYLSGVYNYIKSKFPTLPFWSQNNNILNHTPEWYSKLRSNLNEAIGRRELKNRNKLQPGKSDPIQRTLLYQMAVACLKTNNLESIEKRTEFVCTFLSCGRYIFIHLSIFYWTFILGYLKLKLLHIA